MSDPRYKTWPVNVLVEQEAELRRVPNEHRAGWHYEIEGAGEYRVDLHNTPFRRIWVGATGFVPSAMSPTAADFQLGARIEDGEIVLWLERKPVEQQPVGPPIEAEQAEHACPGGCGHLVARSVLTGARQCPVCGFQLGERA